MAEQLSDEQIASLQRLGFRVEVHWEWKCPFCHRRLKASDKNELDGKVAKHSCKMIRFIGFIDHVVPGATTLDCAYAMGCDMKEDLHAGNYEPPAEHADVLNLLREFYLRREADEPK